MSVIRDDPEPPEAGVDAVEVPVVDEVLVLPVLPASVPVVLPAPVVVVPPVPEVPPAEGLGAGVGVGVGAGVVATAFAVNPAWVVE